MQDWDDLQHVLAVARAGTLSGAARRLRVHETTVARRVGAAEARLGTRLFERVGNVLRATSAGEVAIAHAERVEREMMAVRGAITGADADVAGTVRVTAVPIVMNRLLIPAAAALHAAHPRLHLEMIAEPRDLSLSKREADIALRLARPRGLGTVRTRRIGRIEYAVYAARKRKPDRLPWIGYEEEMTGLPQAQWLTTALRRSSLPPPLAVNDAEGLLQAVRAGIGKSLLPCIVADREPGLRRIERAPVVSRELWLLVHADLRPLARIGAVVDWLERTFRDAGAGP
jgi:DNA-binding transcriptional LysR family regulator